MPRKQIHSKLNGTSVEGAYLPSPLTENTTFTLLCTDSSGKSRLHISMTMTKVEDSSARQVSLKISNDQRKQESNAVPADVNVLQSCLHAVESNTLQNWLAKQSYFKLSEQDTIPSTSLVELDPKSVRVSVISDRQYFAMTDGRRLRVHTECTWGGRRGNQPTKIGSVCLEGLGQSVPLDEIDQTESVVEEFSMHAWTAFQEQIVRQGFERYRSYLYAVRPGLTAKPNPVALFDRFDLDI